MKLSKLCETTSRRDFLKSTSTTGLALVTGNWQKLLSALPSNFKAVGGLAKLYDQLPESSQEVVRNSAFNLVNASMFSSGDGVESFLKGGVKDGMLIDYQTGTPVAPVEAMAGYFSSQADRGEAAYALTGERPENIDNLFPGLLDGVINHNIAKFGPEAFASSLTGVYKDLGCMTSQVFDVWATALKNPALQKLTGLTPEIASAAGENGIGLRKFVDNGIISRDDAKEYAVDTFHRQREKKTKKPKQPEKKIEEPVAKKVEKPEKIEPNSDDYLNASSMHQPFEARLRNALRMISEDEFIHPDRFHQHDGNITFIYIDGELLFSDDKHADHVWVIRQNIEKFKQFIPQNYFEGMWDDGEEEQPQKVDHSTLVWIRKKIVKTCLVGRIGEAGGSKVASFWNTDDDLYKKDLKGCIEAIAKHGFISSGDKVSLPHHGTYGVDEVLAKLDGGGGDDGGREEREELLKQQQELHLMKGDKKDVRKKLGLAAGSKKRDVQQALEKAGKITPGHKYWAMTSESNLRPSNFEARLRLALANLCEAKLGSYITPDDLYAEETAVGVIPFIYLNGHLIYSDYADDTHVGLIRDNFSDFKSLDEFSDMVKQHGNFYHRDPSTSGAWAIREIVNDYHLLGRAATYYNDRVVSFWNDDEGLYSEHLIPCLNELLAKGIINEATMVSTPIIDTVSLKDAIYRYSSEPTEPAEPVDHEAELERKELLRQQQELHLMKGDRKAVREKLGLAVGSKKRDIQQALEKAGLITPGHKYWAMTSESNLRSSNLLNEASQNQVLIEDLILTKEEIAQAVSNLARGMSSQTAGPLLVMLHQAENKYQLVNGYHRVVEALLRGDDSVVIKSTGVTNWKIPPDSELFIPDFSQKYCGMEEFIEHYELRNL